MKLSMISSLALAGAMLLSTSAFAQDAAAPAADMAAPASEMAAPTMIGQQDVSADDLPYVQSQCNTLAGVENTSSTADSGSSPDGAGDLSTSSETPDGTAAALSKVDLALITIEDCKAAGLAK